MHKSSQNPFTISVILPAYNAANFIDDALMSVESQSYSPHEIIVIDDSSEDETASVARSHQNIIYHCQIKGGAATARNTGVQMATGKWIAFLDADDIWLPDKLSLQVSFLENNPATDMVFGHIIEFVSPELSVEESQLLSPRLDPLTGPSSISLMMRRDDFLRTGGFPTDLKLGEFIDWFDRAVHLGLKAHTLPYTVARRRLHQTNQGRTNRKHLSQFALIAKRALDRKRKIQKSQ
jgi:glycosyltransferase involved in cell wall biosynthesis